MEVVTATVDPSDEPLVAGEFGEPLGTDLSEDAKRILAGCDPQAGIDRREKVASLWMPGPAQIRRELLKRSQRRGKAGTDGEPSDRSHAQTLPRVRTLAWSAT